MTVPFILVFIVPPIAALAIGWWAVRRQERALAATRVANLEDVVISAAPDAR